MTDGPEEVPLRGVRYVDPIAGEYWLIPVRVDGVWQVMTIDGADCVEDSTDALELAAGHQREGMALDAGAWRMVADIMAAPE